MILNSFVRTLTRLSLVCLFPPSALDKIVNRQQALKQAETGILPGAPALLVAAIAIETIAPLMIVAEKRDREAAVVLAGFCAATAVLYHPFWAYDDLMAKDKSEGREHLWEFLKNFGLVGGLMTIALDHRPERDEVSPPLKHESRRAPPPKAASAARAAPAARAASADERRTTSFR